MPQLYGTEGCCGAAELVELEFFGDDPDHFWRDLYPGGGHSFNEYTTIVFSDNMHNKNGGLALAAWIKKKRFGTLISHAPRLNPKSHNKIKVWLWNPNKAARKYIDK